MIKSLKPCKFLLNTLCLLLLIGHASAQIKQQGVIPQPYHMEISSAVFTFSPGTGITLGTGIRAENLIFFNQYFKSVAGYSLKVKGNAAISLKIDSSKVAQPEGYKLTATRKQINITGHDEAGVFYSLQSLVQLLRASNGKITIQGCTIEDHPRFAYRGMHLDVSRHFFKVETIKKWIDMLALYKINTFHWHLTDD